MRDRGVLKMLQVLRLQFQGLYAEFQLAVVALVPLHIFGLHPTWHLCWGPEGSTRRRNFSRPASSHSAGLVTISSKKSCSPLDCGITEDGFFNSSGSSHKRHTSKIVRMNTEFALERQKKVVFERAFRSVMPRIIAGCYRNVEI